MEDAMILNKGSFERGFAHGTVYKTEVKEFILNSFALTFFLLNTCPDPFSNVFFMKHETH